MEFSHASLSVNLLDILYAILVAFVFTGVVFAVIRILPRPYFMRRKSTGFLVVKLMSATLLIIGTIIFGLIYTGVIVHTYPYTQVHVVKFVP